MKLELKHISPYLPYGLKVQIYEHIDTVTRFRNDEIDLISSELITFKGRFTSDWYFNDDENEIDIKPILRPLSDLTKEIEHNGEKFVPLIDLYRLSNEYNYNKDLDYEFIDSWGAKGNILKVFHSREKDEYTEFIFSKGSFRKDTRHNEGSYSFGMTLPHSIRCNKKIYNQYKLHQLLFEWHFDVFGLIEKGLAVDINTLNQEK